MEAIDVNKMKALVHYICYKAHDPTVLGAIKLNKVLWYADTASYQLFGKSITGGTYIKRQFGPVPRRILQTLRELTEENKIAETPSRLYGYDKKNYIALEDPDLSQFTPQEMALIDEIFEIVCHQHTATSISRLTHDDIWEIAEIGEEIPYETVFASVVGEVDESDIKWAEEALNRLDKF